MTIIHGAEYHGYVPCPVPRTFHPQHPLISTACDETPTPGAFGPATRRSPPYDHPQLPGLGLDNQETHIVVFWYSGFAENP